MLSDFPSLSNASPSSITKNVDDFYRSSATPVVCCLEECEVMSISRITGITVVESVVASADANFITEHFVVYLIFYSYL